MNWKNRLTNYNFWISLVSAVLLIMQAFNFEFDIANLSEIVTALLGLLVVVGIISNPTKTNQESKPNDSKSEQVETKVENENSSKTENKSNSLKENIESMPSVEQNENNLDSGEDDFKVLVDQISSDIAEQTGILKENVANVVNEIIKTYEEGELMLETEIKETQINDEIIEKEVANQQIESDIEEIAEELLEKEDFEIDEEFADIINEEYLEYKNETLREKEVSSSVENIEVEEAINTEESIDVIENVEAEEVKESVEKEQDTAEETKAQDTQPKVECKSEEVVSFKIVN